MREGSNLLTRPWQAKDDDRKHGSDSSAAERRPRPPCRFGGDACDQLYFPKVTLLIFSVLIFIVVSNASSSSLHLKHDLGQLSRQLLQPPVGSNAGVGETQTRYQSVATLNQY